MPVNRSSRARWSICALVAVLLLAACGEQGDSDPPASPEPGETVEIFLSANSPDDCAAVVAVKREVEGLPDLEKVMRALLAGPTDAEKAQNLGGWFDEKTAGMLNSAEVFDGVAQVDFKDLRSVIPNASSSCGSAGLLAQLDSTARRAGADNTLYSIDGDTGTFYEWLQMAVPDA